ncbi:unnamed protein product [Blumeria hordei]|uniref:Pyridoxamine 5'-phosphate oxidase Alr4036 family FMN-binding domain-containing protein n=1 Tax=Blumeria hordei TaxID=2867405 RepID=A0A383USZ3_BLUHO|nr:unnamed protein product [Blumeria hordei]
MALSSHDKEHSASQHSEIIPRLQSLSRTLCYSSTSNMSPAPWRGEFLSHISKMSSQEFVFSSLHLASPASSIPYYPRARTCIFRGMWAELVAHRLNPAELNVKAYESEMLTMTTDARMEKLNEIISSANENNEIDGTHQKKNISGGGGPVEAVFWAKDSQTQWRIKGKAFVVGKDIEDENAAGAKLAREEIGNGMRVVETDKTCKWSWARELTAHFGNLSPSMRGTFKNPFPGTPITCPIEDKRLWLGQDVYDLNDSVARENFCTIVIKPEEVEQLSLKGPKTARRWKYSYVGAEKNDTGNWKTEELWP